jgi:NitT/TauT family transport system substrate-binding protein
MSNPTWNKSAPRCAAVAGADLAKMNLRPDRMGLSHPVFFCLTGDMRLSGNSTWRGKTASWLAAFLALLAGCGVQDEGPSAADEALVRVVLQTDWFPQPEHGGFYQALAKGYYREAGLDVEILPGGPNAMSVQKVLKGTAHFAMNRADTIYQLTVRGAPLLMVMATLQHDPQAILLHADDPADSLGDLDGRRVMAVPGLSWIKWIEAKYDIQLDILPHDFGMDRFLSDPRFIQQCLLTNEPFYMRRAGADVKVLPLSDSGFDPYHGIYCLREFAAAQPEVVARFVAASIRGWSDFILNDPAPALARIAELNPKMTPEFMAFSVETLRTRRLVTGRDSEQPQVGRIDPRRMRAMASEMRELGLVEGEPAARDWFTTRFLIKPADAPAGALP